MAGVQETVPLFDSTTYITLNILNISYLFYLPSANFLRKNKLMESQYFRDLKPKKPERTNKHTINLARKFYNVKASFDPKLPTIPEEDGASSIGQAAMEDIISMVKTQAATNDRKRKSIPDKSVDSSKPNSPKKQKQEQEQPDPMDIY